MIFDSISYTVEDKAILQSIYLKIETNKINGLFGLNGSGKSTLIKIGAGYLSPTSGSVFIDSINYSYKSHYERYNQISYLSQSSFLPIDVSVKTVLKWFNNHEFLMNDSHIQDQTNKKIYHLSGGELKYLELCLLLSLNRKYILLDEPFTGIEPKYLDIMIERLHEYKDNDKGILITDHYYRYMSGLIDNGYFLKNGYCKQMNISEGTIKSLITEGYING